ncbi:MAG: glycohydrolase toxin TNT-related protein [Mycobacteriaceae bacterium]
MGIALPTEVGEAAGLALNNHWPGVDEDTLTSAASAYGDTARSLGSAAGDADRHTQHVLAVSAGGLARGLRSAADRVFGTENSHVATAGSHCASLADGLAIDAGAVRETKLLIFDELCSLTEILATLRAAGPTTGGSALLQIPLAVSGSAGKIEALYQRLVQVLSGTDGGGLARSASSKLMLDGSDDVLSDLRRAAAGKPAVDGASDAVSGAGQQVHDASADAVPGAGGLGSAPQGQQVQHPHLPGWVDPAAVQAAAHVAPPGPLPSAPSLPYQPPISHSSPPVGPTDYASPSPTTYGAASQQSVPGPFAALGDQPRPNDPQPTAPARVLSQWAEPPKPAAGAPSAAPSGVGDPPAAPTPRTSDLPPTAPGRHAPAAVGPTPRAVPPPVPSANPGGGSFAPGPVSGTGPAPTFVGPQPAAQGVAAAVPGAVPPRALLMPGARATAPAPDAGLPRRGPVDAPVRVDDAALSVPAVVVVEFPPGLAPRRCARPARQLPVPQPFAEPRPGLCCPAGDHPDRAQLADPVHLAYPGAARGNAVIGTSLGQSGLLDDYDPLGGMHERQLERRFVVRAPDASMMGEYAWPPCEMHPEGAADPYLRTPELLPTGTEMDLLGSAQGRVLAAAGTQFAQRSLPQEYTDRTLSRLVVWTVLPVWKVQTAAWFGQPGGGVRYRLTHPVAELVAAGVLVETSIQAEEAEVDHG